MNQNNKEILVSISCITYNHAPYIRQCLDGFMMQKTNFLFEVLIHDDASTDGTTEIIREYAAKYPDIIKPLYEEENQWLKGRRGSAVFNFPRAKGKYIALCEGDDYWTDPLKLQKQVDIMEMNPEIGLVHTQAEAFDDNGVVGHYAWMIKDSKSLLDGDGIVTLTSCFRRDLLEGYLNDVKPEKRSWLMSDYPMWFWILHHSKSLFLDEVMGRYRILQNSASRSTDINRVVAFENSVLDVKLFYIEKFWDNDKEMLKNAYTMSTWYIFRLLIVNKMDQSAFNLFFSRYKNLWFRQKVFGLILWMFPFIKVRIRHIWSSYTRLF